MGLGMREALAGAAFSILTCVPTVSSHPLSREDRIRAECKEVGDEMHNRAVQIAALTEGDIASMWEAGDKKETDCLHASGLRCEEGDEMLCGEYGNVQYHGRIPYWFVRNGTFENSSSE